MRSRSPGQRFVDRQQFNQNNYPPAICYQDSVGVYSSQGQQEREYPGNYQKDTSYRRSNSPSVPRHAQGLKYMQNECLNDTQRAAPRIGRQQAFSDDLYFKKFGMPPNPCRHCGMTHWERHCHQTLN